MQEITACPDARRVLQYVQCCHTEFRKPQWQEVYKLGNQSKRVASAICLFLLVPAMAHAAVDGFGCHEDFADVDVLRHRGWTIRSNSEPMGAGAWRQGDPNVFSAWSGAVNSFAMVSPGVSSARDERVSIWLITPGFDFDPLINARQLSFYTRATPSNGNRLLVRMCVEAAGDRCDAPSASADDIGNFTSQLLDIDAGPIQGGYPVVWTAYFSDDLPIEGRARFAFHYYVHIQNGRFGSTIGVDSFAIAGVSLCPFQDIVFTDDFDQ